MQNSSIIKATVVITTYNQAAYIEKTIMSALLQKTNFNFEVIVADDSSTDNTKDIVLKIANKYPNIRYLRNTENKGFIKNYSQCIRLAKGEYIAELGGDDKWTTNKKLQLQVDFLDKNIDYGLVHTQYDILYKKKGKIIKNVINNDEIISGNSFEKIIRSNRICAITACFRRDIILKSKLLDKFEKEYFNYEDLPQWLEISLNYKVKYLDISTAEYLVVEGSLSHPMNSSKRKWYLDTKYKILGHYLKMRTVQIETKEIVETKKNMQYAHHFYKDRNYKCFKNHYSKIANKSLYLYLVNIYMNIYRILN